MAKSKAKPSPKSKGLGKGLSALMSESYSQIEAEDDVMVIGEEEEEEGESAPKTSAKKAKATASDDATVEGPKVSLPLAVLKPGKFQPRRNFDATALSELSESIRKNGVMQPILVRPIGEDKYEIIAGERRWRASQMAGMDSIPVVIREMKDELALELALVENIQRKDLNPLEEAIGYQRLMDEFGYTQEMLATTVHKSRSHIANLLRMLALPDDVRQLLEEDKITMGHARALLGTANPAELAQEVIRKGLNVRQTEKLANAEKNPGQQATRRPRAGSEVAQAAPAAAAPLAHQRPKDPDIMALEDTLSENLGLKVSIEDRGQSGEIMISYESLEQLDEILRRLGGSI